MSTSPQVDVKIALLEQDQHTIKDAIKNLATTTEKIGEVASYVAKILAVHETRLEDNKQNHENFVMQTRDEFKEVNIRIEQCEDRIMKKLDDILDNRNVEKASEKVEKDKVEQRLLSLERWRWMLAGGGMVIGFLLGKLPYIANFILGVNPAH